MLYLLFRIRRKYLPYAPAFQPRHNHAKLALRLVVGIPSSSPGQVCNHSLLFAKSPELTLSVAISEDRSWKVAYHDEPLHDKPRPKLTSLATLRTTRSRYPNISYGHTAISGRNAHAGAAYPVASNRKCFSLAALLLVRDRVASRMKILASSCRQGTLLMCWHLSVSNSKFESMRHTSWYALSQLDRYKKADNSSLGVK